MPPMSVPRPSVRRPAVSIFWSIFLPVRSPSARNMPVDSIITTIITRLMVRIRMGSNTGAAISNGSTMSNQFALATFSNVIRPAAVAITPPPTMPSNTEMLATKPLANLAISRMAASTMAAMPMCESCAYFGLGTLPTMARPCGIAGTAPVVDACFTLSSQARCSGLGMLGAVGPKGLPKIQLMPTRMRLTPITAMMVPVTTGGKKRSMRLTMGAIRIETTPAPMMEPKMRPAPACRVAVGHGHHRGDRSESHTHHHRQLDAEPLRGPQRLDQRDQAAAEQVGRDQHRHLLRAELERAAHDQRHGHRTGVHHQHMLQAEGGEFAGGSRSSTG
ncbi:hypothetical protein Y695_03100 [Hydrogenophaga sp. T4]|nr:hypothetical protein Y695_03100 [Hydrogenophaga sp. T4]